MKKICFVLNINIHKKKEIDYIFLFHDLTHYKYYGLLLKNPALKQ